MIKSLYLHNFKCFEEQTLHFNNLTLLAGLNGMGKSSVLQSLLLLRQSKLDGSLDRVGLSLNGELVEMGTVKDIFFEGATKDEVGFSLEFDKQKPSWTFNYDRHSDVATQVSQPVPDSVYQNNLFTDNFHYLQAERIGPRKTFAMSEYKVSQRHQLGPRGEYTAHYLSQYGSTNIPTPALAHPEAGSLALKDQVEAWMGEISPGVRIFPAAVPDLDLVSLRFGFVQGKEISNSYRSTNVGFGISYALHIIVALLSASKEYLVLIENPEAHLHPRGQVRMGELIARAAQAGTQIILETHSDHILNGVRVSAHNGIIGPENIKLYFLSRKDDGSTLVASPSIDRNGRLDLWPEGFFDEWDKSLGKLLDSSGE
jgi:predicted ATPase